MSTNNDTPANGSVSDVNAAPNSETAAAIASANLNSGTDCATTSDSTMNTIDTNNNAVAPVSESESFTPVLLSDGILFDALGYGTTDISVNGSDFAIDKANAQIRVKLTVDDSGILVLRHQESGQKFEIAATLPSSEWTRLDDPNYWQTVQTCSVPRGHYTVNGIVSNHGTASSQNRTLMRYEIELVAGVDVIDPIPPDEPEEETMICCECGGCSEKDGNGNVIAVVDLPGESFMGKCFTKSEFEELQQQTASISEEEDSSTTLVSGGLKYTSAWDWKATVDAENSLITVTPPKGEVLSFTMVANSSTAAISGNARKYQFSMQLLDAQGNPDTTGSPAVLKLVAADGSQIRFDAATGKVLTIRSAQGRVTSAADFAAQVHIDTDSNGLIQSVYSATDGFMRTTVQADGSTLYEWFTPAQVSIVDGAYQTSGEPYKTESYLTTVTNGVKTTTITRQQAGLPAHTLTRVENGNVTTITKGSGEEAIIRTISKNYLGNNVMETIESVSRANDETPASCIRELRLRTDGGWIQMERTEGYGSDIAQTTKYEYDNLFRVSRVNYPNGGYTRYEYDAEGREVLSAEPWSGGHEKRTRTVYSTARFFDNRPVKVYTDYVAKDGTVLNIAVTDYTYEDSASVERTTTTKQAAGVSHQQVTIDETYGEAAAYTYAAGKPKFSQAVNGVQTFHEYEATTEHGAIHKHTTITKADGELVAAQSHKTEEFIAANDTTTFEQEFIWDGENWLLLNTTAFEYDEQQRVTKTTRANGRFATTDWMCCGKLREVDEDGIQTDYAYDSAHQMTEITRAAVYDGDTCITPETITEFTRDAAGRPLSTTHRIGAMETTESSEYDALGRVVKQTDILGRVTSTAYSSDGLTTTVTTPAGATLITTNNTNGSVAHVYGTGQRELYYAYDLNSNNVRETIKLGDNQTILSQSINNGFGETLAEVAASTTGFIYTRSEYNAKGQVTKRYQDTGSNTTPTAPTLYEYDSFGNITKQTLALAEEPTKDNSPVVEVSYGVESTDEGVFSVATQTRYNTQGNALTFVQKQLISKLSDSIENKSVTVNERGLTSEQWSVYNNSTKRTQYSTIPTSDITAETVMVDGFVVSQKDNAGVTSTTGRVYTASGMTLVQTDGRGNSTTTSQDKAGRTLSVTDAANNVTSYSYDTVQDNPAMVTDARNNTTCYKYDNRGRKVAEWGTGIQPACFGYDDSDRMTTLRTFRASTETISTDPSERTDGDVTSWTYHVASGVEIAKTYADGKGTTKTYDAFNRLITETDGRSVVKTHSYEHARGLLLGTAYSDGTTARAYTYNHLGQLTQVVDAAGTRAISYNAYVEQETDSLVAGEVTHLITENRDNFGRSSGFTYAKNGSVQHTVTTSYGTNGRISTAGFLHGGNEKQFVYNYLPGSKLLQTLIMPNNMTLTQSYEENRDLLTGMYYRRGTTGVVEREYSYDSLGRPTARNTARQGKTANDTFDYNNRSELISAMVNNSNYAYDYDNIGNRETAQEAAEEVTTYAANNLNQYTAVGDFSPTYDDAGNQTKVRTSTGIWDVVYNAENRPTVFSRTEDNVETRITCAYDYMGRRATKQVQTITTAEDGSSTTTQTLNQRYLYRGYLQIACCDLTRSAHPCLWLITWDPTQPTATRPLAIRKDGTWYAYGWDLTKNICEVFGQTGYIRTSYSYTPYGEVIATGNVEQPVLWSSEFFDSETMLSYYNYRYYNLNEGRWLTRDSYPQKNTYKYCQNASSFMCDILGNYNYVFNYYNDCYYSYFDINVDPERKEIIENFRDALAHYRSGLGGEVKAGQSLYHEMKIHSSYRENVIGDGNLPKRIKKRLKSVEKDLTHGTFTNLPNSTVGYLYSKTLGSYQLNVKYTAYWYAGHWQKTFFHFLSGNCYRKICGDITLELELNEKWDFKDNPEYNILQNIMYERIPDIIASWNTINPKEFTIVGKIYDRIYLSTEQYQQ